MKLTQVFFFYIVALLFCSFCIQ